MASSSSTLAIAVAIAVAIAIAGGGGGGGARAQQQQQAAQLREDYYASSCPNVEATVRRTLRGLFLRDPTSPAAMLRLAFHDCQVFACDASILLEEAAASEMQSGSNGGVRRLEWIDGVKAALEAECPGAVSCADVVAMSARDAVALSGGPDVRLPLGRLDAAAAEMTAAAAPSEMTAETAATAALPAANVSVAEALQLFPGMGAGEVVALLGAHTLGVAHCRSFAGRLFPARDPAMSPLFANALRARCSFPAAASSAASSAAAFAALDSTSFRFDSAYFRDLLNGRGLLPIDSSLALDPRTLPHVRRFASDPPAFFSAFSSAFLKLTSKVAPRGEVRINCRRPNSSNSNNSFSGSNGR